MAKNDIRNIDLDLKTDIKITFSSNGTYTEEYLNHSVTGKWFPHNENLAESRTDSDIKIKKLKKHIQQKIKSANKNKNKMIRLLQRMHRLNRMTTKSFKFENNYIYAYDKQHSWILVFTKRDKN